MELIAWLVVGLLTGWYTAYFMESRKDKHYMADIILGALGALVGGGLMYFSGISGPALLGTLDTYALIVAILGAGLLIWGSKYISGLGQTEEVES